jgi:hypothetical protein
MKFVILQKFQRYRGVDRKIEVVRCRGAVWKKVDEACERDLRQALLGSPVKAKRAFKSSEW